MTISTTRNHEEPRGTSLASTDHTDRSLGRHVPFMAPVLADVINLYFKTLGIQMQLGYMDADAVVCSSEQMNRQKNTLDKKVKQYGRMMRWDGMGENQKRTRTVIESKRLLFTTYTARMPQKKGRIKSYKTDAVLTAYSNNTRNDNNKLMPHSCARQKGENGKEKK